VRSAASPARNRRPGSATTAPERVKRLVRALDGTVSASWTVSFAAS